METYPDAYIEYWGEIYTANPVLRQRGILFHAFLHAPDELLAAVTSGTSLPLPEGEEFYPLLPAQRRVHDKVLIAEIADALERQLEREHQPVCRDGRLIEPLRHHAFPNRNYMRRIA